MRNIIASHPQILYQDHRVHPTLDVTRVVYVMAIRPHFFLSYLAQLSLDVDLLTFPTKLTSSGEASISGRFARFIMNFSTLSRLLACRIAL